jgi:hypothetical protein
VTTPLERLDELLLSEAIGRLSDEELAEVERLLAEQPGFDRYAWERAVAAVFLAVCAEPRERMPDELSSKLVNEAIPFLQSDERS